MKIYNTLTKQLETLPTPEEQKSLNMFVCGPTVYDYIHIGNARTFVFFDVVAKYLRHKGYDVNYIQNITDIDNKIIEKAEKEGADPLEYARKYTEIFKEDMKALGITSPEYRNATDHIGEVIKQVQTLLDKGNAYVIENDGIYFDLSTFPDYGKLSGRTSSMADDAVSRIDDSNKKRNKGDFAIWKFAQHNDPSWPAPFGNGRPGWHIEDTAITDKYFGPQYDIHGGGQDLIFPHHEAEIAQQESASGKKPFVKYWMHVGFLVNKDAKMSKSVGNFVILKDVLKKYDKETIRHFLLARAHYKTPLQISDDSLSVSGSAIENLRILLANLSLELKSGQGVGAPDHEQQLSNYKKMFFEKLEDDLNIPEAFAVMSGLGSYIHQNMKAFNQSQIETTFILLNNINQILGIVPFEEATMEDKEVANEIDALRQNKEFSKSDKIREELRSMGSIVSNTPAGTIIIRPPSPTIQNDNNKEKQKPE